MNSLLKFLLSPFLGKSSFQKFFGKLFVLSLKGMNYGYALVSNSGEENAFRTIRAKYFPKSGEAVIFDVGANEGDYCEMLLRNASDRTKIFAFEPSAKTFQKFTSRVKNNKIVFENFGLSKEQGEMTLHVNSKDSGLASVYERNLGREEKLTDATETIKMKRLDDYCKEKSISKINFLKMDVEGHELSVLEGAKEMLAAKNIDVIQFEFGGTNIDSRTFLKDFYLLLGKDFDFYRVLQNGLEPLGNHQELYEIFFTVNFVAVRKGI